MNKERFDRIVDDNLNIEFETIRKSISLEDLFDNYQEEIVNVFLNRMVMVKQDISVRFVERAFSVDNQTRYSLISVLKKRQSHENVRFVREDVLHHVQYNME